MTEHEERHAIQRAWADAVSDFVFRSGWPVSRVLSEQPDILPGLLRIAERSFENGVQDHRESLDGDTES